LINQLSPEIILLQEIKTVTEKFPQDLLFDKGYNCAVIGQKSYNGVAILSKSPISDVKTAFCNQYCTEARYIECITDRLRIASVYVPNGREVGASHYDFKLSFMERLSEYLKREVTADEHFIIGGDFNIALNDNDVWDPAAFEGQLLFTDAERSSLKKIKQAGLADAFNACNQSAGDKKSDSICDRFTWWDYRASSFSKNHGIRLDYVFLSALTAKHLKRPTILKNFRALHRPSDHAPMMVELSI
jgi:exodeoxyribonuclease-3